MRHPATATVKGEKNIDCMVSSLERFRCFGILPGKLLLAALDWRGVVEFQRAK